MTLPISTIGENPQQPGIYAETFVPDQLIAGNLKLVTDDILLMSGKLPRGSVLGKQTTNTLQTAPGASNTGNGTIGSTSLGATPLFGVYTLEATGATTFAVTDPEGNAQANATVGTAYASGTINFTITAGATAFAAGDTFTITVTEATGNYVLSVKTASDGSQVPCAILVSTTDASTQPQLTGGYLMGEFNGNALNFDPSWTVAALRTALRAFSIFVKSSVSAADPT
jgi:hypothetical protein